MNCDKLKYMKKFKLFYNGKLSLAQSFWIWLVLPNVAFKLTTTLLAQLNLIIFYLLIILINIYLIFAIIGVWKSATNYINKKKKTYWGWLAKISAIAYASEVLMYTYMLLIPVLR